MRIAAETHEYSSTHVTLPPDLATRIIKWGKNNIADTQLSFAGDAGGRETDIHCTLLYGILSASPKKTQELLSGEPVIKAVLGKISCFENDDFDVVKIEVISKDLCRLHNKLRNNVPNENTYADYKPHITIAYTKKGEGKQYEGDSPFSGVSVSFDTVTFSSKDEHTNKIALGTHQVTNAFYPVSALNWNY